MDASTNTIDELINKRANLENQLQELRAKQEASQGLDMEINLSIMRITNEIETLSNRINSEQAQRKRNHLNNIRNVLGVSFHNHIHTAGTDPSVAQMIPKTPAQLQMEYMQLNNALHAKLGNDEISEEQYDIVANSLAVLYAQYKEEISDKKDQKNNRSSNQSQPIVGISDFEEMIDFIDEDLLQDKRFLQMFKLYNMIEASEEDRKRFMDKYRQEFLGEEEKIEIIEPVERTGRKTF